MARDARNKRPAGRRREREKKCGGTYSEKRRVGGAFPREFQRINRLLINIGWGSNRDIVKQFPVAVGGDICNSDEPFSHCRQCDRKILYSSI
jgi:hypothetical protein